MSIMNTITTHPVYPTLFNHIDDVYGVDLDDSILERIMSNETPDFKGTVSAVRVVEKAVSTVATVKVEGNLTSRIYCLLDASMACRWHEDFQEMAMAHPAFELIRKELTQALVDGDLNSKFDQMDATGAIVTFNKQTNQVTIGVGGSIMRSAIREYTPLVDLTNKSLVGQANYNHEVGTVVKQPAVFAAVRAAVGDVPDVGTTYFVTFTI